MKKTYTLLAALFAMAATAEAQTTLPYFTGFDDAAQQQGWIGFRRGDTSLYNWAFTSNDAYSAPSSLYHDYPVGGTQVTDDWYVSPPFNFTYGGTVDSLRYKFSGFGTPGAGDTVAIYLLTGNADPDLATSKTMLVDFRGTNYTNDNNWYLHAPIQIPATAGQSFLAFRYTTTINWLDVRFDNVAMSALLPGAVADGAGKLISVFPNPVTDVLKVDATSAGLQEPCTLALYNSLGVQVLQKAVMGKDEIRVSQPSGAYFYQLTDHQNNLLKTGKLLVR